MPRDRICFAGESFWSKWQTWDLPSCRQGALKSVNWPVIVSWMPVIHLRLSALGRLHCCQESEPWHCDPLRVVLRLRLWLCHKGQLLWTHQLGWIAASLLCSCFTFQTTFIWFYQFILLSEALKLFYSLFLFWLLSVGLFFFFCFFFALPCCLFALFSVFYFIFMRFCMLSDFNLGKRLVKSLSERCYISRVLSLSYLFCDKIILCCFFFVFFNVTCIRGFMTSTPERLHTKN